MLNLALAIFRKHYQSSSFNAKADVSTRAVVNGAFGDGGPHRMLVTGSRQQPSLAYMDRESALLRIDLLLRSGQIGDSQDEKHDGRQKCFQNELSLETDLVLVSKCEWRCRAKLRHVC